MRLALAGDLGRPGYPRVLRSPVAGTVTGMIPIWLPSSPPLVIRRAATGTVMVTSPSCSSRAASRVRSAPGDRGEHDVVDGAAVRVCQIADGG
jgi:hypothetical protein